MVLSINIFLRWRQVGSFARSPIRNCAPHRCTPSRSRNGAARKTGRTAQTNQRSGPGWMKNGLRSTTKQNPSPLHPNRQYVESRDHRSACEESRRIEKIYPQFSERYMDYVDQFQYTLNGFVIISSSSCIA